MLYPLRAASLRHLYRSVSLSLSPPPPLSPSLTTLSRPIRAIPASMNSDHVPSSASAILRAWCPRFDRLQHKVLALWINEYRQKLALLINEYRQREGQGT